MRPGTRLSVLPRRFTLLPMHLSQSMPGVLRTDFLTPENYQEMLSIGTPRPSSRSFLTERLGRAKRLWLTHIALPVLERRCGQLDPRVNLKPFLSCMMMLGLNAERIGRVDLVERAITAIESQVDKAHLLLEAHDVVLDGEGTEMPTGEFVWPSIEPGQLLHDSAMFLLEYAHSRVSSLLSGAAAYFERGLRLRPSEIHHDYYVALAQIRERQADWAMDYRADALHTDGFTDAMDVTIRADEARRRAEASRHLLITVWEMWSMARTSLQAAKLQSWARNRLSNALTEDLQRVDAKLTVLRTGLGEG
jgi:hypothetical protein